MDTDKTIIIRINPCPPARDLSESVVEFKEAISESSEAGFCRAPANPTKSIRPPCAPARCRRGQIPRSECRPVTIPPHRRKNQRPQAGPGRRSAGSAGPAADLDSFPAANTARASCWKFSPTTFRAQQRGNFPSHARFRFARQRAPVNGDDAMVRHDVRLRSTADCAHVHRSGTEQRMTAAA